MAISQDYRGTTYSVPETDEEDWGAQGTTMLVALLAGGDSTEFTSAASNVVAKQISGADLTIAAAGTITWTANRHKVAGDGGAVTVDATTGISAGEADGQPLRLIGTSDTNTVTLAHAGNVSLNGTCVLRDGYYIDLEWVSADSQWEEVNRSH